MIHCGAQATSGIAAVAAARARSRGVCICVDADHPPANAIYVDLQRIIAPPPIYLPPLIRDYISSSWVPRSQGEYTSFHI